MKTLLLYVFAMFLFFLPASFAQSPSEPEERWWNFIPVQDSSGDWWDAIEVPLVPGVMYHLESSSNLLNWNRLESKYGLGQTWVCPVMRRSSPPPSGETPEQTYILPEEETDPVKQVSMTLGKSPVGQMTLSWLSLDDQTHKTKTLAAPPDPAWEDFEGFYLQPHGNFFFALSPRFGVTDAGTSASFGPLDLQMLSVFEGALGDIADHISDQMAAAAAYSAPVSSTGDKEFYRVVADWAFDSNGGGRYDWQQLLLDGTDPFAPGEGPGGTDVYDTGVSSDGYPQPTDAQPPTPGAKIEQRRILGHAGSTTYEDEDREPEHGGYALYYDEDGIAREMDGADTVLAGAAGPGAFVSALESLSLTAADWTETLHPFYIMRNEMEMEWPNRSWKSMSGGRSEFRLKLDAPAPEGGYRIPMRVLKIRFRLNENHVREVISSSGADLFEDILLEVQEGETEGLPAEVRLDANLSPDTWIEYIPVHPTLALLAEIPSGKDVIPADGICVVSGTPVVVNYSSANFSPAPGAITRWQKRTLQGTGLFTEWSDAPESWIPIFNKGVITITEPGCHQIRLLIELADGREIPVNYVRMRHARSIKSSLKISATNPNPLLKAGQPDYLGVAQNSRSRFIRDRAVTWLGSEKYRRFVQMSMRPGYPGPSTDGSWKCNIFITHMANQSGATTPYFKMWKTLICWYAPLAFEDWYSEPEKNIDLDQPGWVSMGGGGGIFPGRVAAGRHHCGIIDYDGSWISAGQDTVNKSIHFSNMIAGYKDFNIRARLSN